MLKIFNELKLFFEDVFREISVREYARELNISPPTASKTLKDYEKEGLLISDKKGIYIYFRADKENYLFRQLSRLYWFLVIYKLTKKLHEQVNYRKIILFGSLSKSENTKSSDVDLFLDTGNKEVNTSELENNLKRKIQLHFKNELKNKYLKENIHKGIPIR